MPVPTTVVGLDTATGIIAVHVADGTAASILLLPGPPSPCAPPPPPHAPSNTMIESGARISTIIARPRGVAGTARIVQLDES